MENIDFSTNLDLSIPEGSTQRTPHSEYNVEGSYNGHSYQKHSTISNALNKITRIATNALRSAFIGFASSITISLIYGYSIPFTIQLSTYTATTSAVMSILTDII